MNKFGKFSLGVSIVELICFIFLGFVHEGIFQSILMGALLINTVLILITSAYMLGEVDPSEFLLKLDLESPCVD